MICIIPARGGSKRLPGKNIRPLDGVPVINRVIKIAQDSNLFDEVILSTDSVDIASVVNCSVSFRPKELCGDVSETAVLQDVLLKMGIHVFCRIYPFAALLTPERLQAGFEAFSELGVQAVMECQRYGHPPRRRFTLDGGYVEGDIVSLPTEMLQDTYHDAGTYMFSTYHALDLPLAERNIKWIPVKEWEAQDIDCIDDWNMLELKYRGR